MSRRVLKVPTALALFNIMATACWVITLLAGSLLAGSGPLFSQEGETASKPNLSREQMEEFLLHAKVVGRREIPVGITRPVRLTLDDGSLKHDAQLQTVNESRPVFSSPQGTELNFRDYYAYNIAAYRLDKLLNLNMIPASVERKIGGKTGAVTWWVDDVQMMEKQRWRKKIEPPDRARWNDQMYQARVFNELVYNTDPNLGNLLITEDWKIWMVDFTRAFRRHKKLRNPKNLTRIDRRVYNGLRNLNEAVLTRELGSCLNKAEIRGLLARRDLILKYFDEQVAKRGEAAVFCDKPGP